MDWLDAEFWDTLAEQYLSRYNLPPWDLQCDPETLALWMERCDLTQADFLATGHYHSLSDFIALNPDWPLRAAIGLMLERRHEHERGKRRDAA